MKCARLTLFNFISVCTFCCPADHVFGWLVGWGSGGWCVACGSFPVLAGTGGGARPWVVRANCPTRPGQQYIKIFNSFANLVCFSLWRHCKVPQHYLLNFGLLLKGEPHEISFNNLHKSQFFFKIGSHEILQGVTAFSAPPPSQKIH